ncbi:glycosyltransferase 87 family protein [Oscillatoria sp. FACHB-1406]|uniref:AZOBR_p60025 family cell surface glycopolymer formation protein n=1 Tax=Oscillatoria sp. FACHB-1406 TaxID=2692846 RepID=UPI0016837EE2|nr:glycosyltransferase 87 family protein [Oscillatoria sp. FACHB-1406]MBD2579435.1 DUF2029 domain-containing protein [Oscillatoria sp. FACHB-1406]
MTFVRSRFSLLFRNPVILGAIVVFSFALYLYIFKFQSNIYGFFRIGSVLPFSPYLELKKALIFNGELGFDGQQFLSIAFDPLLHNPDTLSTLDSPRLRYRRILYPLLSYVLGLGNVNLIPYVMVAINIASILGLTWIFTQYSKAKKWRSLFLLCIPGVWIVLSLSTADLLNSLLTIAAFYCYQNSRIGRTAILLSLAYLTKEISVMMGLALILNSAWKRQGKQILYLGAAFIPTLLWNIYVLLRLKSQGFLGINENFGTPLLGITQKILALINGGFSIKNVYEAYAFFLLIVIFASNLVIAAKSLRENRVIGLATLLYGVLFISSSMAMLSYFLNYPRQYIDVYFLLLLTCCNRLPNFERLKLGLIAAAGIESVIFIFGHS